MTTKPIDLGALQDAVLKADALIKSTRITMITAQTKMNTAIAVADTAKERYLAAVQLRYENKLALMDAARQVANG